MAMMVDSVLPFVSLLNQPATLDSWNPDGLATTILPAMYLIEYAEAIRRAGDFEDDAIAAWSLAECSMKNLAQCPSVQRVKWASDFVADWQRRCQIEQSETLIKARRSSSLVTEMREQVGASEEEKLLRDALLAWARAFEQHPILVEKFGLHYDYDLEAKVRRYRDVCRQNKSPADPNLEKFFTNLFDEHESSNADANDVEIEPFHPHQSRPAEVE